MDYQPAEWTTSVSVSRSGLPVCQSQHLQTLQSPSFLKTSWAALTENIMLAYLFSQIWLQPLTWSTTKFLSVLWNCGSASLVEHCTGTSRIYHRTQTFQVGDGVLSHWTECWHTCFVRFDSSLWRGRPRNSYQCSGMVVQHHWSNIALVPLISITELGLFRLETECFLTELKCAIWPHSESAKFCSVHWGSTDHDPEILHQLLVQLSPKSLSPSESLKRSQLHILMVIFQPFVAKPVKN